MSSEHTRHRSPSTSSTVKPPPPADVSKSPIENAIDLTPLSELGPNVFTNTRPQWQPMGARGIYGGSVIAQSLLAAQLTVPPTFVVHSMHCYFVLAGDPRYAIIYHVDIVRSGRSFHTRTVQARQRGKVIFTTTCSFTVPLSAKYSGDADRAVVRHQPAFPADVCSPEECEGELEAIDRLLATGRIDEELAAAGRARRARDPFEWRLVGVSNQYPPGTPHPDPAGTPPAGKVMRQWVRSKAPVVNPLFSNPALAYFSDSWFIGTVGRVNPAASRDKVGMMVSLDHTIYFHAADRMKVEEWILIETECPWTGEERGLVKMKVWARDGTLLASCIQEGMVRLKDGREGDGARDAATPVPAAKL